MAKEVKIKVKMEVDGKETVVAAVVPVKELAKALEGTGVKAKKTKNELVKAMSISTIVKNAQDAIMGLQNSLNTLAQSYYSAEEQKQKMLTVMQQRMDATEGEIAATNKLIAAQTDLGVIGGTVQRAGAQQLATFLTTTQSLNTLIPAMNNLVAQQRGLTASQQDAVGVANLMGKVMTGQTSALRRVGITFTDAQEKALKFGSEEERAAVLAQVITDNVGNMNQSLASTNAGYIKQITNSFGAWKVKLGQIASNVMPALITTTSALNTVLMITQIRMAGGSVLGFAKSLKAVAAAFSLTAIRAKLSNFWQAVQTVTMRALTGSTTSLGVASYGAAAGVTTLKMAIRGLMITSVIGAVVAVLTFALEKLMDAFDDTGDSAKNMANDMDAAKEAAKRANDTFTQTNSEELSRLQTKYTELQIGWKKLRTEHEKNAWIKANQSAFEDLRLSVHGIADAEDVFVKNTSKVMEAFKKRAEAAALSASMEEDYKTKFEAEERIRKRNQETQQRHPAKQVGDTIDTSDNQWSTLVSNQNGKYAYVDAHGRWVLNARGAQEYNKHRGRWYANGPAQKKDIQIRDEADRRLNEKAERLSKLTPSTSYAPTPPKTTPHTSDGGHTGGGTTEKPLTLVDTPKTEEDFDNNIRYWEEKKKKIDMATEAYRHATAEIDRLRETEAKLQGKSNGKVFTDDPKTKKQFEDNLSILRDRQENADKSTYADLEKQIDELEKKYDEFKGEVEKPYTPAAVSELKTLGDIDKALQYNQDRLSKASASEISDIQKTIDALNHKKDTLQGIADLTSEQTDVNRITSLKGGARRRAIKKIGASGFTDKIDDLQSKLDSGDFTGDEAKKVQELIKTYKGLRSEAALSFNTLRDGWSGVKNIGSGIQSMTEAIEGNGDAWTKITGVVDAALQVYDGISAIIGIIQMLTGVTQQQTAVEQQKAVATTTSAVATTGEAVASTANAVAKGTETSAVQQATAAKSGEALVNATESGSKMPFPMNIVAIAMGVAAVISALAMAAKFATGGVVGGAKNSGDKLFARVNSGEMILNKTQQARLFAMLNTGLSMTLPSMPMPRTSDMGPVTINTTALQPQTASRGVRFELKGRSLVGVLANETRLTSRKTNIRI